MRNKFTSLAGRLAVASLFLAPVLSTHASTAGPGTWSANQTWAADTVNGGNLTGYFYWPASQPTLAGKRALVLVLHGCTQTATADVIDSTTDGGFNWKAVADQYGAVVLAPNATGNVYSNHCWDYANTTHNRTAGGHDAVLLELINRFKNNPQYDIDPNQVYVTGLSSGGGETMVMGCLAPDVFAGIGINAGPTPGTTTLQIGTVPSGYTSANAASKCSAMAGTNSAKFATQIAGAVWGTADYTVAQGYGPIATAAFRQIYGDTFTKGATTAIAGSGSNIPYTDSNGKLRTHEITVSGMGHAWPAGQGGQNASYVDATRVNYPAFVMDFWYKNNLRVSQDAAPVMTSCSSSGITATSATINGAATDNGSVASYKVVLNGATAISDAAAGSGAGFSKSYNLANGYYTGSVTATDNLGQVSSVCSIPQFLIGTAPAILPPTGLTAGTTTSSSVPLSWNAVGGATGYNIYRNGSKITSTPVTTTSYTSTGLVASTTYSFAVSSTSASGESVLSSPVSATTQSSFVCTATNTSNYTHVQAGRAINSGGYALAVGSNQNMGLNNTFYTSILAQTSSGYYVIGNCP
ncbi:MAG: PHB depolymerase family esterase [Herminiimonas sp.]|nr:PHB depolymerase family esterase [Herminiimonas sp.]